MVYGLQAYFMALTFVFRHPSSRDGVHIQPWAYQPFFIAIQWCDIW